MPENIQFERLQDIGSFGLVESGRVSLVKQKLGGGYRRDFLIGPRWPLLRWQLKYDVLPGTMNSPIQLPSGNQESRADYLWNLFFRSKCGFPDVNRPIIVTSPLSGKDYLAVFSDDELSMEMFLTRLFRSQVQLEQVRVRGVATMPDGSLDTSAMPMESANPDHF